VAKILVAYDGSQGADVALDVAASVAKATEGAEVAVLSVAPVSGSSRGGPIDPTSDLDEHDRQLDAALARLKEHGIDAHAIKSVGHPADTIVRIAEERDTDLVVVGSRGLHGVKRFAMGSVSARVAEHAPCSVLVAR
jgi:nucleotide-binding universal stress UspA family protein